MKVRHVLLYCIKYRGAPGPNEGVHSAAVTVVSTLCAWSHFHVRSKSLRGPVLHAVNGTADKLFNCITENI